MATRLLTLWKLLGALALGAVLAGPLTAQAGPGGSTLALITGQVFEPGSGVPLEGVLVYDYASGKSDITDANGEYGIAAAAGPREMGYFGPTDWWSDKFLTIDAKGGKYILNITLAQLGDFISAPIGLAGGNAFFTDADGYSVSVTVPQGTWTTSYSIVFTSIPTHAQTAVADSYAGGQITMSHNLVSRTPEIRFDLMDSFGNIVTDQVPFANQVTVVMDLRNPPAGGASGGAEVLYFDEATASFASHGFGTVDSSTNTVTFQTDHFSTWEVVFVDGWFCDCAIGFRDLGSREVPKVEGPIVNGKVSGAGELEYSEGESVSSSTTSEVGVSGGSDEGQAIGAKLNVKVTSSGSFSSSRAMSAQAVNGADTPCSGSGKWELVEVQQGYEICVSCFPCPPWQDCAEIWVTTGVKIKYTCD